jgi:hypothetical protein
MMLDPKDHKLMQGEEHSIEKGRFTHDEFLSIRKKKNQSQYHTSGMVY